MPFSDEKAIKTLIDLWRSGRSLLFLCKNSENSEKQNRSPDCLSHAKGAEILPLFAFMEHLKAEVRGSPQGLRPLIPDEVRRPGPARAKLRLSSSSDDFLTQIRIDLKQPRFGHYSALILGIRCDQCLPPRRP